MTEPFRRLSKADLVCVLLLMAMVAIAFACTADTRAPWFGRSPNCFETYTSSAVVLWTRNWCNEGPLALWFAYFMDPRSIEFPTLASRAMYTSYPPGACMPIYLIAKILHRTPSMAMVMAYSIFAQCMVAALLALTLYLFLRYADNSPFDALVLSAIPIAFVQGLPSPASLFQLAHLHVAVLFPFAACVFLETLRDMTANPRARAALSILEGIVAFYGTLTDWLFVFVALCLYLKRLATGGIVASWRGPVRATLLQFAGNSARFWTPPALALGLFAAVLYRFHQFGTIAGRFEERAGVKMSPFDRISTNSFFWHQHIVRGYGVIGKYLLLGSCVCLFILIALSLIRRPRNERFRMGVSLAFLILTPCLLHILVFRQDSSHFFHYFTTAKFCLPIATVPLVLFPASLLAAFGLTFGSCTLKRWRAGADAPRPRWSPLPLAIAAFAGWYVGGEFPQVREQLEKFAPLGTEEPQARWAFLDEHTGYEDVCFTPNSLLEAGHVPIRVALSMKCVYVAADPRAIYAKVKPIEGEYVVDVMVRDEDLPNITPGMKQLLNLASDRASSDQIALYKIPKQTFLSLCRNAGIE